MFLHRSGRIAAAAVALLMLSSIPAGAAPEGGDAKTLLTDARNALKENRFDDAVKAFRKADELESTPQLKLELAQALIAAGKLLDASKELNSLVDTANSTAPRKIKQDARAALDALEPRIPWLQIKIVGPEQRLTSTTVDGKEIDAENEVPIDPGEHVIAADADGYKPAEKKVTLAEGVHETVEVQLEKDAPPPPPPKPVAPPPKPASSSSGLIIPMGVAFGVGAIGLGVGTVFGIMALNETADLERKCSRGICPDDTRSRRAQDAALADGNISTVSFIVGGVGVAAGGVLLGLMLASPSPQPKDKATASVSPWIGAGQAGVHGTF